jgi:hypothetical protein
MRVSDHLATRVWATVRAWVVAVAARELAGQKRQLRSFEAARRPRRRCRVLLSTTITSHLGKILLFSSFCFAPRSPFPEIALVLVRFNCTASRIVNTNNSIV